MQHFKDIVNHRRAVREYDANQSLVLSWSKSVLNSLS